MEGSRSGEGGSRGEGSRLSCQIVPAAGSKTGRNTFDHNHPPIKTRH